MNIEFEKKVKILTLNFEIEIRKLEEKYNEVVFINNQNLRGLNQKIQEYQERLKELDKTSISSNDNDLFRFQKRGKKSIEQK